MSNDAIRILFVTITPEHADAFVQTLCTERLIACGNILPGVRSHYWWDGKVCQDEEAVVFMETSTDRLEAAMRRIEALHPYECPKIVTLDPKEVHDPYARWVTEQTRPARGA